MGSSWVLFVGTQSQGGFYIIGAFLTNRQKWGAPYEKSHEENESIIEIIIPDYIDIRRFFNL